MNRLVTKLHLAWNLLRFLGPSWLFYRLSYAAQRRLGYMRRQLPATMWDTQTLDTLLQTPALADSEAYLAYRRSQAPPFFFAPHQREQYQSWFPLWDAGRPSPVSLSDELDHGIFRYFGHIPLSAGFPPDWHTNLFNGLRPSSTLHWSQMDDFGHGDIKVIWELNRFGFTYMLVRAYWRTGDERHAEMFWSLLEDWRAHNPPHQGANWKCGQETSIRVMAWCFGLYGFLEACTSSARRVALLAQMIAVSGQRIAANIDYALSQRNNHGISEGAGLWTIGTLFPELRQAAQWREEGRRILEDQAQTLIYPDGSFSQHSVNYHRLMLHTYVWVMRLGKLCQQPFSDDLHARITQAAIWLYQIQDEISGRVPCYGNNDGSLILPLNTCDDQDYRPVIQAAHYLCHATRCYSDGPWDEDLLWLYGVDALHAPTDSPPRRDFQAHEGGYYTLRDSNGFAFLRCATFIHRPGHADMLHLDLWWRGQNIALDAGTYSYNAPSPWNNSLAHTAYHNTITVDETDQMERLSRFFWAPWVRSRLLHHKQLSSGKLTYWEGEHNGYARLSPPVRHRRGVIRLGHGWWLVLDGLTSTTQHTYRQHWLFPDASHTWDALNGSLTLQTRAGPYYARMGILNRIGCSSLVRADQHSPRGWRAPRYASREPALSVVLESQASTAMFWTLFGPQSSRLILHSDSITIETTHWTATITTQLDDSQVPLLTAISAAGMHQDIQEVEPCISS